MNSRVILFICAMIIVMIFTDLIMARLSYKPTFDWWNQNKGSNYTNKFSLSTCMMSYYSTPLYYLNKITIPPQQFLSLDQIAFLVGNIFPYMRTTINGVQSGIVIPRHLCESVLLKSTDGDDQYNSWYSSLSTNRDENSKLKYSQPTVTKSAPDSNGYTYTSLVFSNKIPDPKTGFIGVYPSVDDTNSWMGLISEWGGPGLRWQPDKSTKFYSPEPLQSTDPKNLTWFNWNNTGAPRPDNFLARMGIPPDSPLVVYFCTGKYSIDGMIVDPSAFLNLIQPAGANAGGWIGYIRGRGTVNSPDELRNYIYTQVDWISGPNKACSSDSALDTTTSAVATAVPLLMMLPALAPVAPPFGILAGLIGIAGMTTLSTLKSNKSTNC